MKYKDILGYSKPKKKVIKEQKNIKPKPNLVIENIKKEFGINEGQSEQEYIKHYEGEIFDAINQFKRVFERTEWKRHRSINKIIKELFKLEQKLSNEVGDL